MIIHYIKLTDYKRIKLNNLKTIEIDFSEPLQLILGTNGCGKSSILSELTPYPPSSEFYSKGGGKVIHISHHNCSYILSTVFLLLANPTTPYMVSVGMTATPPPFSTCSSSLFIKKHPSLAWVLKFISYLLKHCCLPHNLCSVIRRS